MPDNQPYALVTLPLSEEDLTFWRAEIERSDKRREQIISAWDVTGNLERYTPKSVKMIDGSTIDSRVNVAKDFSDVERKNAALFNSLPTIALIPDPATDARVVLLHQELLNTVLGEEYMDVLETVSPTIQDCLVAIQPAPTEIGYRSVQVTVQQPVPKVDPATGQPLLDLNGQPAVEMQDVPVTVWEEFFWTRISPKAQLLPTELRSTKYDKSPWIGYRWRKPTTQVTREYQLGPEFTGADNATDKPYFEPTAGDQPDNSEPMVTGVKLWYRATYRDPNIVHPDVIRELELADGHDVPLVHRNCPYQEIDPKSGRLTVDSIVGFPEHPLALRDLTDSEYVGADCTITSPLTRELNKFRTQVVQRRDASKLHMLMDTSKVNSEVRQKIEDGDVPKIIPVEAGALDGGADRMLAQVPAVDLGRESYIGQDIIERDRAQILGIDANQVGSGGKGGRTATEISTVQRNSDARFERERMRAARWFLRGVQKVSAIVLRYGDRLAMEILGPERGPIWIQAKNAKAISKFKFRTVLDTGVYIDIEDRKRQDLQLYNLTAKDPTLNRSIVQARLATDFGLDPATWLVSKQPEQKPEPPSLSISVKPEDLDPMLPSYVGTYAILTAGGVKGLPPPMWRPPQMVQTPPPDHGGMAELTPRLNQHQLAETGEQPGPKVM